jgi:hypothetical protein
MVRTALSERPKTFLGSDGFSASASWGKSMRHLRRPEGILLGNLAESREAGSY